MLSSLHWGVGASVVARALSSGAARAQDRGTRFQMLCRMRTPAPQSWTEAETPALQGRFLTTELLESPGHILNWVIFLFIVDLFRVLYISVRNLNPAYIKNSKQVNNKKKNNPI